MAEDLKDENGRIAKIANNRTNQEDIILNPISSIIEKLNWYRSLFGKVQDLSDHDYNSLKKNIVSFFNLKSVVRAENLPRHLIRISHNSSIFKSRGEDISYIKNIKDLLAPPANLAKVNRCNLEGEQVLYCSLDEASAYWEVKPKYGDIITLTRFVLKEGAYSTCSIIVPYPVKPENFGSSMQIVYALIREFFVDVFTLKVDRDRPRDYLFSATLCSDQLYYPVPGNNDDAVEAIIYPSVQRAGYGDNIAIRNDRVLEKYHFVSAETRFILDEFENLDPMVHLPTTDQVMGSFYSYSLNHETGEISYGEKVDELFGIFKMMQDPKNPQQRIDNGPDIPKNISFNLSSPDYKIPDYLQEFNAKRVVKK